MVAVEDLPASFLMGAIDYMIGDWAKEFVLRNEKPKVSEFIAFLKRLYEDKDILDEGELVIIKEFILNHRSTFHLE